MMANAIRNLEYLSCKLGIILETSMKGITFDYFNKIKKYL